MSESLELRYDIAELIGLVASARRNADAGLDCDLSPLPGRVEAVCGALLRLPREDALRFVPVVEKLMGDLDEAGRAMDQRRRRVLGEEWRASMAAAIRP